MPQARGTLSVLTKPDGAIQLSADHISCSHSLDTIPLVDNSPATLILSPRIKRAECCSQSIGCGKINLSFLPARVSVRVYEPGRIGQAQYRPTETGLRTRSALCMDSVLHLKPRTNGPACLSATPCVIQVSESLLSEYAFLWRGCFCYPARHWRHKCPNPIPQRPLPATKPTRTATSQLPPLSTITTT